MANDTKRPSVKSKPSPASLPAGDFSEWLSRTRRALIDEKGVTVECGDCRGCCTSSYFVHIRPEEKDTLAVIDRKLLFPAPGLPKGHKLMGYFENGFCPMMTEKGCRIYAHRPITCRNYDCRIFAAAGLAAGGEEKATINERVLQWEFSYSSELGRKQHAAVTAAAEFVQTHSDSFSAGSLPGNPSQIAILAIKAYEVFFESEDKQGSGNPSMTIKETAEAIIEAVRKFEAQRGL